MKPWNDSVKKTGKLTIYMGALAGPWVHVFREAVRDVNHLSNGYKLGFTLVESHEPATEQGGAQVSAHTANGTIERKYKNIDDKESFVGTALHGRTLLISPEQDKNVLEKAFIYLPAQPLISSPQTVRAAGPGVMKVVAAHELLHACGLENGDHQDDDLFQANPRASGGARPADDKILIGTGPKGMPPLILGPVTAKNLQDLWT